MKQSGGRAASHLVGPRRLQHLLIMDYDLKAPPPSSFSSYPPSASSFSHPPEPLLGWNLPSDPEVIGIIGSGDFSRSLALRLVASGFRVMVGSRHPLREGRACFPEGVELLSQKEAAGGEARVVFIAVHPDFYPTLEGLREALAGKVLVDVSNATHPRGGEQGSNAEWLAEIFPDSRVVKAFNVVSAWTLQAGAQDGNRKVLVCSNCPQSKALLLQLARRLGFTPVDLGVLTASRHVEEVPLLLFPSWGGPVLTTFLLFLFFYGYIFLRNILLPFVDKGQNNFYQLPLDAVNQALPAVALVTLALVYLPGQLAAALQLWRGTKYRLFPGWLDRWLCVRKELGLLSLLMALLHAVYSVCLKLRKASDYRMLTAAYRQVKAGVESSWSEPQVWRSDLYLSCGILGIGVLSLLAITSLPSVGNSLNWREFTFVQSSLGYVALTLSVLHAVFFGWDFAFWPSAYPYFLPPVYLLALILPCLVLVGRLVLVLPCLALPLARIRRGWESARHQSPEDP
ncbi:metalloreductase STEAP3 isoform X2 [Nelusetta ayraudi]|uniref:metalloreductase STEAP3 isoform X2 n=1 Tax=Nelusetta ayraudi TaxID=303726 RepID=UPI003F723179